jgi:hypothetical protein
MAGCRIANSGRRPAAFRRRCHPRGNERAVPAIPLANSRQAPEFLPPNRPGDKQASRAATRQPPTARTTFGVRARSPPPSAGSYIRGRRRAPPPLTTGAGD